MLDAAQRLVDRAGGLTVSLESMTLDQVIKEAGVSRTSVYREWDKKEDFYVDLLCDLAGPSWQGTAAFDEETIRLARSIVAERIEELRTEEGRRRVLRETVRRAARQNFNAVVASSQWRTYVALTATVMSLSDNEARTRVRDALQAAERVFIERMSNFYADMSIMFGFRLKSYINSYETLAAVGASVVEGLGLRQSLTPDIVNRQIMIPGPDGPEEWHLAALGFLGILEQCIEPQPDYNPDDALKDYLKQLASREKLVSSAP
ncbi:hypothetical protein DQ237_15245 [Blastococcus sp. TF02-8]|nr:hypothetical protein DQ237_15245 [Blastococcus sp. TF02-8]